MSEDAEKQEAKLQPRITVDYGKGRWDKVFHIFDMDGGEVKLHQKAAVTVAKRILKIAKVQDASHVNFASSDLTTKEK